MVRLEPDDGSRARRDLPPRQETRPKHDIPYLAGYSLDGKTIYIDRHMPQIFKFRGRTIDTDRFLILHEEVEKTLIDQLGPALPARPPDRDARRGGGGARGRHRRGAPTTVHAEIRQEHRRRTAHQGAEGSRSQTLSRRAGRRFAAPHAEKRACRKGCPKGIHVHDLAEAITGSCANAYAARYAGGTPRCRHQAQGER